MAGKIFIRFGQPGDAERFEAEGLVGGAAPPNETWQQRIGTWFSEQQARRRIILVAEDASGILGFVQIVFSFPEGYTDLESANGHDIAMMEGLRLKTGAPVEVGNKLVSEVQVIAQKRNVKTLTFCLPMEQNKALTQAKLWGFKEFRIMPQKSKMVCFFRKELG
ncbi:MAG: hypothetical protein NVS9B12_00150 [Vulcanimicrobiaceae bacterium]